jgi:protein ImuA
MTSRPALLPALAGSGLPPAPEGDRRFTLGLDTVDARLGGGLAMAALHEFYAQGEGDAASVAAFALLLALRCGRPGPLLWLREDRAARQDRPYGLGLADLGLDPARLVLVQAPDTLALLRAGAEAVACAALAAVILEPFGGRSGGRSGGAAAFDLTASRRFMLAAARSGVLTLALRSGDPVPSAAQSRWQVAGAPSEVLGDKAPFSHQGADASFPIQGADAPFSSQGADAPFSHKGADAPGPPVFAVTLLRHRSGIGGFATRLEWDRDSAIFTAPRSGPAPAAVPLRAAAAPARGRRRAA